MVKWLIISFGCWAVLAAIFTIWRFIEFDRLLKRVYVSNHDEWLKLGMPMGFFWVPKDLKRKSLFMPSTSRSALFVSISMRSHIPIVGLSAGDYAGLRLTNLLSKCCFTGALICFCLAIVSIFL